MSARAEGHPLPTLPAGYRLGQLTDSVREHEDLGMRRGRGEKRKQDNSGSGERETAQQILDHNAQ